MTMEMAITVLSLIWLPILLYQIKQRGFLILLIWLLVAPVASNVVNRPQVNPFLDSSGVEEAAVKPRAPRQGYIAGETTIRFRELFEPSRLLFGAYFIVFIINTLMIRKLPVPVDKTEKWMAVFSLVVISSVLLQSKRTAFGLRIASDAFIVPFLAYAVARRLVSTEDHFRKLSQVIGYLGFYLILISFLERLTHADLTYRLSGPFAFRDALYVVMVVVFFVVLIGSMSTSFEGQKPVLPRGIQMSVLSIAPIIIFLTWTRALWLGFVLGLWVFAFLGYTLVMWRKKVLAVGLVLSVLPVTVLGFQQMIGTQEIYSRVSNTRNIYGRLATYEVMVEEFFRNPVFGIGLNNTRDMLWEMQDEVTSYGFRPYRVSHNSYLALAVEVGVVGLLGFLAIVGSIFSTGLRVFRTGKHPRDCWRGIAVIAIMIAYFLPALFDTTLYKPWLPPVYVYVYFGAVAGLYFHKGTSKHFVRSTETRDSFPLTPQGTGRQHRNTLRAGP